MNLVVDSIEHPLKRKVRVMEYKMKKIVVFEYGTSREKMKEGMAVQQAITSGACNLCEYLGQCMNDRTFKFPQNASCMKIMNSSNN